MYDHIPFVPSSGSTPITTPPPPQPAVDAHVSRPRLPIEIIERIIDFFPFLYGSYNGWESAWTPADTRAALRTCFLVCRAFVPRCRLHLLDSITLRTEKDLTAVENMFNKAPGLAKYVSTLTIDVVGAGPQSWVSAIPFALAVPSMELWELRVRGVDFTTVHVSFQRAFTRFAGVSTLRLEDIRYSRYSQVTRFIHAINASALE